MGIVNAPRAVGSILARTLPRVWPIRSGGQPVREKKSTRPTPRTPGCKQVSFAPEEAPARSPSEEAGRKSAPRAGGSGGAFFGSSSRPGLYGLFALLCFLDFLIWVATDDSKDFFNYSLF